MVNSMTPGHQSVQFEFEKETFFGAVLQYFSGHVRSANDCYEERQPRHYSWKYPRDSQVESTWSLCGSLRDVKKKQYKYDNGVAVSVRSRCE